jgi:hypothetical protein
MSLTGTVFAERVWSKMAGWRFSDDGSRLMCTCSGAVIFDSQQGRYRRILADRNVRVDCLGVEANAKPTSAPHHPALTGQSQRGAPQKPVQASFHATTNECCAGKTSAGRYKALCS